MSTHDIVFDHTGFITPSIERSVRFWTEVLGFQANPIVERKGAWVSTFTGIEGATLRLAHLHGHGADLEFIEFVPPAGASAALPANRPGVGHVCLKVLDIRAMYDRILAGGGALQGQLSAITEGPAAGIRGLYMRDPHGVVIELLEMKA